FLEENFLAGVIDCTGHGVPGALMTMMASTGLRRITTVDGCRDPAEILRRLNHTIKKSLHQDTEHAISDDGLDASICYIDRSEKTLTYAGARLPLTYLKDNKIETIKGDHQSIGYRRSDLDFKFVNHTVDIQKEMTFYLYSDGIIDQLGGEKRIPFGRKRLHDLLRKIHNEPFDKQQSMVYQAFEEYKGDEETQDDITVLGFSAL
ncbi:serine/threonine-protein phosphatase, partial [bacterium]|nr:serine/threonine-protein phosphatase [bacterium]